MDTHTDALRLLYSRRPHRTNELIAQVHATANALAGQPQLPMHMTLISHLKVQVEKLHAETAAVLARSRHRETVTCAPRAHSERNIDF